ncbi:MAG: 2Fe-2S iron-sulfur cluster-binding protein [Rhodocyclaceae bacterium]
MIPKDDMHEGTFFLDGMAVPFAPGQTLLQAAHAAGRYIPHLCWHPDYMPHGSCRLCSVKIAGRTVPACATAASAGLEVENRTPELDEMRRMLLQMLFVEGNHFCPSCEKSGRCLLQATAYELGMMGPHFDHFYPNRPVDASHPDMLLDFNRCILCSLCEQASARDGKFVFVMGGRGMRGRKVIINSESGKLADTDFSLGDRAATVCPVGVILKKRVGFATPIGRRKYDRAPVSVVATQQEEP